MSTDPTPHDGTPEDPRIEALRDQLADARVRTRHSLLALESEIRTGIVNVTHWPQMFQTHRACFIGAAVVAGFLFGRRRPAPFHLQRRSQPALLELLTRGSR